MVTVTSEELHMANSSSAERYEMVCSLGEGGMGSVWLAWDTLLHRNVAIKRTRVGRVPGAYNSVASPERVLREARALSRLDHRNIVRVIELVERDEGPWIVMEYVQGHSLAEWITQRPAELTEDRVAEIGLVVLGALGAAHKRGVIHRDVKPANILIKDTGGSLRSRICLVDFGNAAMEGHELTTKGNVIGTFAYTAPERFDHIAGKASDLWSLGVTLYEAVERRLPFQGETLPKLIKAISEKDPAPPQQGRLLAPVLFRLLEKDPGKRPHPDEAGAMLRQVIAVRRAERARRSRGESHSENLRQNSAKSRGGECPDDGTPPPVPSSGFAMVMAHEPKVAVAVLGRQGPRQAAQILGRMAMEDPDGAVAVIKAMTDRFAAELLRHAAPVAAVTVLLSLPADHGARLITQVPQASAIEIVLALPTSKAETVRLMLALPPRSAARLLNYAPAEHAVALMEHCDRRRTTAVLTEMAPRRAAGVLDLMPSDLREAAAVLRGLPRDRVGIVLDQMAAARVAAILQVEPAAATQFLRLMRPEHAREVIACM
jgi:flagellar motility protein MotE (MotC chaperone)